MSRGTPSREPLLGADTPFHEDDVQTLARLSPHHSALRVTGLLQVKGMLIPSPHRGTDTHEAAVQRLLRDVPDQLRSGVEGWIAVLRGQGRFPSRVMPWATIRSYSEPFDLHERHTRTWTDAERGTAGDDVLSLIARLLARAPAPMTRTDILAALPHTVREPHHRQMDGLGRLLHRVPAFHQPTSGKWQLGRTNMQITASPWT